MLLVVHRLVRGDVPDPGAKRLLSKVKAPRGAMTQIVSNVNVVVAICYSSPQRFML